MADIASLLQVSDLHLFEKITFTGGRHWGLRAFGVKGHSFSKLYTFARTIRRQRLVDGLEDLCLATGDISTDGTTESLTVAKGFFDDAEVHENGRFATWGLALPKKRQLVLPGNHDRYGDYLFPYESAMNRTLERVFNLKDEYPYVVAYRRPNWRQYPGQPTLLFYVFDSTLARDASDSWNPMRRIARGTITEQECDWLEAQPALLASQGYVLDLEGQRLPFEYDNTIRIALLHHHPVRKQKHGLSQIVDNQSWSIMEGAPRFLDACFDSEVDLVLFGHEHENYNEFERREINDGSSKRVHTIRFVCCPSTMEYSEERNGYYMIDFDADKYRMTLHEWRKTAFFKSRTYTESYNRPLRFNKNKFVF